MLSIPTEPQPPTPRTVQHTVSIEREIIARKSTETKRIFAGLVDIPCLFRSSPSVHSLVLSVRFQNLICFVLLYWFAWLVVVGYCLAGWYASSVVGSLVRWFVCFHLCLVDQNTHLISIVSVAPIYVISLVSVVWILYLNEKKISKEAMQDYACKEDKRHSLDTSTELSPLSFSPPPY